MVHLVAVQQQLAANVFEYLKKILFIIVTTWIIMYLINIIFYLNSSPPNIHIKDTFNVYLINFNQLWKDLNNNDCCVSFLRKDYINN